MKFKYVIQTCKKKLSLKFEVFKSKNAFKDFRRPGGSGPAGSNLEP